MSLQMVVPRAETNCAPNQPERCSSGWGLSCTCFSAVADQGGFENSLLICFLRSDSDFFVPYGYVYVLCWGRALTAFKSSVVSVPEKEQFLVKQQGWAWCWRNGIVSKCHFQSLKSSRLKTAQPNFTNRGWLEWWELSRWTFSLLLYRQMVSLLCWIDYY